MMDVLSTLIVVLWFAVLLSFASLPFFVLLAGLYQLSLWLIARFHPSKKDES